MEFSITEKVCPICKILKSIDDFDKYFSKERQRYRIQNYCKVCQKLEANKRAKIYYQKNIEKIKKYAKEYQENPHNYQKIRNWANSSKRQRRKTYSDSYIRDLIVQQKKFKNLDLLQNPELVKLYRNRLLLKKTLKKLYNGKK